VLFWSRLVGRYCDVDDNRDRVTATAVSRSAYESGRFSGTVLEAIHLFGRSGVTSAPPSMITFAVTGVSRGRRGTGDGHRRRVLPRPGPRAACGLVRPTSRHRTAVVQLQRGNRCHPGLLALVSMVSNTLTSAAAPARRSHESSCAVQAPPVYKKPSAGPRPAEASMRSCLWESRRSTTGNWQSRLNT